jgi:hypothetical protein
VSVAQALAGPRSPAGTEAGIEQRFARRHIAGALGADRKRSRVGRQDKGGLPQGSAPIPKFANIRGDL